MGETIPVAKNARSTTEPGHITMPTTYKMARNERGYFEVRWSEDGRSRRQSLKTQDMEIAKDRLAEFLQTEKLHKYVRSRPIIQDCLDYYMRNHGPEMVDLTRAVYLDRHVGEHFGNFYPKSVDPDCVQAFIKSRRVGLIGRVAGDGTIRRELSHLDAALNYCARHGVIKRDEIPYINKPPAARPKERWLTQEEINAFLDAIKEDSRLWYFVHIALRTGARKTSILELKWDQIDMEGGLIDFGKHDKAERKKKRRPIVPISDKLMAVLKPAYERNQRKSPMFRDEYVLKHPGSIRTAFELACAKAALQDVTPHTLRHTWASHAAMNGVSFLEIARVLGNSVAMVEKVYAKFAPDYLKNAINAVNF